MSELFCNHSDFTSGMHKSAGIGSIFPNFCWGSTPLTPQAVLGLHPSIFSWSAWRQQEASCLNPCVGPCVCHHKFIPVGLSWERIQHVTMGLKLKGLTSDNVKKPNNAWQRGKLVLNKDCVPYKACWKTSRSLVEALYSFVERYKRFWRLFHSLVRHISRDWGSDKCARGRFSVDRRFPSMLLYGTLSSFRTNFAGCCVVT